MNASFAAIATAFRTGDRRRFALRMAAIVLACCGAVPLAQAAYLEAKASLAQVLLQRAWQKTLISGESVKPWSWADIVPVARLHIARLNIEQIVLSGDSGRALAFGPGWTESSALPGAPGLSVISAHRDTHFAFLRELRIGETIEMQTQHGMREYRVRSMRIADANHERIDIGVDSDGLLLVTCYPFDALIAGGSLRYVVSASPVRDTGMIVDQGFALGASGASGASGARGLLPRPRGPV